MMNVTIFSDGGARGNPGPAAIGAVVTITEKNREPEVMRLSETIGVGTNNQAEYRAIQKALAAVKETAGEREVVVNCYLDSLLVVSQLNGLYKIKNPDLKIIYLEILKIINALNGRINFFHVPREKNRDADFLVNRALDRNI